MSATQSPSQSSVAGKLPLASAAGRVYWRGLEELAETPEFREWVEREFPAGASELTDPVSRRQFVKLMSASFLLAGIGLGATGCRRPVERLEPFGKMPENYIHGLPEYFATAMPAAGGAIPLVVKSNDGRPTKVEGNSLYPDSNGGTDRFAQASILNLYDPDRATRFTINGKNASPAGAVDFLGALAKKAQADGGKGLSILCERNNSPSRARLQKLISEKLPKARFYVHDAIDLDIHRRAATEAFAQAVQPQFLFDRADVIVSLDCDFLGSEPDVHNHVRRFTQRRRIEKPEDGLNRLYVIESLMTITGFNADHRLRAAASSVVQVAGALAAEIAKSANISGLDRLGSPAGVDPQWISECAKDLLANAGRSLVVAGYRQPLAVHLLANAINAALGNVGKTVVFHEAPEPKQEGLGELAKSLQAGEVETLLILGGNPVYTAPAELDWAKTQRKAKMVARLGYYEDETFPHCDWHFPAAHYLESWGDALTSDGTMVPVQPLIAPLFGGLTELEILARLAGANATDPYTIVRETFATLVQSNDVEREGAWRKFLHDGFRADSAAKPVDVKFNPAAVSQGLSSVKTGSPTKDSLEVVFFRDYKMDDGRYNNNGWLQELPDPVTKMVWDNAVLISRKTAVAYGVKNTDLVEVTLNGRKIKGPIWIQPGMAENSLGLSLGYGRERTGRVGQGTGFNVYPLRTADEPYVAVGATLQKVGKTYPLSGTQAHWSLEGRPIVKEANLEQYREHPQFAKHMGVEDPPVVKPLYPNPFEELRKKGVHQWGMSIDLNLCVGCSACMLACQSENNVPIVGKDQVNRGREMHWLRIDRYYAGKPLVPKGSDEARKDFFDTFEKDQQMQFQEWIDNPQVVTQPMLCQHCEAAPCENVCPVNATSHDQEGLNVMTYNRCVGTRYCSNNCPYKVRRFNFFDWNKRPLGRFTLAGHEVDKWYLGPFGHRKDDEWDLLKMVKNPDVTVRMRGVMEKCTYCLQRIEQAKIAQKTKAGASGDVVVPSDSFTTACAQACPAGAIVFGNLNDHESHVWKRKQLDRDYPVLEALLTKPRTTYLAKVRNPNKNMPDYYKSPLTTQEFEQKFGNPFEEHSESGANTHEAAEKGAR